MIFGLRLGERRETQSSVNVTDLKMREVPLAIMLKMTEVPVKALWDGGGPRSANLQGGPESVLSLHKSVSKMDTHECLQTSKHKQACCFRYTLHCHPLSSPNKSVLVSVIY